VRHESVIARIEHRGVQEPVDKDGPGFLGRRSAFISCTR
jgi:hypothetical protein